MLKLLLFLLLAAAHASPPGRIVPRHELTMLTDTFYEDCMAKQTNRRCDLECWNLPQLREPECINLDTIKYELELEVFAAPRMMVRNWEFSENLRKQMKTRVDILTTTEELIAMADKMGVNSGHEHSITFNVRIQVFLPVCNHCPQGVDYIKSKLLDYGTEALHIRGIRPHSETTSTDGWYWLAGVFMAFIIVSAICAIIHNQRSRKRRHVNAPVWIPPFESSDDGSVKRPKMMPQMHNVMFPFVNNMIYHYPVVHMPYSYQSRPDQPPSPGFRTELHDLAANSTLTDLHELLERISNLVRQGVPVNALDHNEETALFVAVRHQKHEVAERLIDLGADANIWNKHNSTCLHHAVYNIDFKMVKLLIEKCGLNSVYVEGRLAINAVDENGKTALMAAAELPGLKTLRYLIESGADVNDQGDESLNGYRGRTALHYAALAENIEGIKILIENGADVNKGDEEGQTPLHLAVSNMKYKSALELLTNSLKPANPLIDDKMEMKPIHLAKFLGYHQMEALLKKYEGNGRNNGFAREGKKRRSSDIKPPSTKSPASDKENQPVQATEVQTPSPSTSDPSSDDSKHTPAMKSPMVFTFDNNFIAHQQQKYFPRVNVQQQHQLFNYAPYLMASQH